MPGLGYHWSEYFLTGSSTSVPSKHIYLTHTTPHKIWNEFKFHLSSLIYLYVQPHKMAKAKVNDSK
jgi:hypothetical protein